LPLIVDGLLGDALIAERAQRRMGRARIDQITAILDERLSGREPDLSQSVFDDGHQEVEARAEMATTALMAELKTTLARLAASDGEIECFRNGLPSLEQAPDDGPLWHYAKVKVRNAGFFCVAVSRNCSGTNHVEQMVYEFPALTFVGSVNADMDPDRL
jgi:hypothetical protein